MSCVELQASRNPNKRTQTTLAAKEIARVRVNKKNVYASVKAAR